MSELLEKTDLVVEVPQVFAQRLRVGVLSVVMGALLYLAFCDTKVPRPDGETLAPPSNGLHHAPGHEPPTAPTAEETGVQAQPTEARAGESPKSDLSAAPTDEGAPAAGATAGAVPSDGDRTARGTIDLGQAVPAPKDDVTIAFRVVPKNARMVVNGEPHKGDLVVARGPNEYLIIFSAPGYEDQVYRLTGERSLSLDVDLVKLPPRRGSRHRR